MKTALLTLSITVGFLAGVTSADAATVAIEHGPTVSSNWTWSLDVVEVAGEVTVVTGPISAPGAPFLWTDSVALDDGWERSGPLSARPKWSDPEIIRVALFLPTYCPCRVEFRDEVGEVLVSWGFLTYASSLPFVVDPASPYTGR